MTLKTELADATALKLAFILSLVGTTTSHINKINLTVPYTGYHWFL